MVSITQLLYHAVLLLSIGFSKKHKKIIKMPLSLNADDGIMIAMETSVGPTMDKVVTTADRLKTIMHSWTPLLR